MTHIVSVHVDCENTADIATAVDMLGPAIVGLTLQTGTYASLSITAVAADDAEVTP